MHTNKHNPPPATAHEKAAAFDRIARAFLEIPAGTPPIEELKAANERCIGVVAREVMLWHPAYRKSAVTGEQVPTLEPQQADYDRRKAAYVDELQKWRESGMVGDPPPRPVKPHTPGGR